MRHVTIKDVAEQAGVSYATVSRALSDAPGVAPKTRARIAAAAEEMGYTVNSAARAMVKQRTGLIGLVLDSPENPLEARLLAEIEQQARESGFGLLIGCTAHDDEPRAEVIMRMARQQAEGVLIHAPGMMPDARLRPVLGHLPHVFLSTRGGDLPEGDAELPAVAFDAFRAGEAGAQYLHSLGHRRICLLTDGIKPGLSDGCAFFCRAHDMALEKRVFDLPPEAPAAVREMAALLFDAPGAFTAVFAETDALALTVLSAAAARGVRIPGSLSLLGCGNVPAGALPVVQLTTLAQNAATMAHLAVGMLAGQISSGTVGGQARLLTPTLVCRGTCKAVGADNG